MKKRTAATLSIFSIIIMLYVIKIVPQEAMSKAMKMKYSGDMDPLRAGV